MSLTVNPVREGWFRQIIHTLVPSYPTELEVLGPTEVDGNSYRVIRGTCPFSTNDARLHCWRVRRFWKRVTRK